MTDGEKGIHSSENGKHLDSKVQEKVICHGQNDEGNPCQNELKPDDLFCDECGTPFPSKQLRYELIFLL